MCLWEILSRDPLGNRVCKHSVHGAPGGGSSNLGCMGWWEAGWGCEFRLQTWGGLTANTGGIEAQGKGNVGEVKRELRNVGRE